ncbi:MAG: hypothetical protein MJA27_22710, partial [Pseudanabaenales cyanobacterium]|nr:hypothetical protein [Pseudanabaenales cyanobacterium]
MDFNSPSPFHLPTSPSPPSPPSPPSSPPPLCSPHSLSPLCSPQLSLWINLKVFAPLLKWSIQADLQRR